MDESAFFPAQADARHSGCASTGADSHGSRGRQDESVERDATSAGDCTSTHHHEGWAELPGCGAVPASMAREHLLDLLDEDHHPDQCDLPDGGTSGDAPRDAGFWLRRLWTSPDGRDLVTMDSRQRFFSGELRRLLELRDPRCRVPWCDAPARQIDHVHPAARGGVTSAANGAGLCQCHNLVKEETGWAAEVISSGVDPGGGPHELRLTTPTGQNFDCPAPPLFGSGRPSRSDAERDRLRPGADVPPGDLSPIEVIYTGLLHAA